VKRKTIITAVIFCISLCIPLSLFPQTGDEITAAINSGDCGVLYEFLQDTKGKEGKLVTNTKYALGRYTGTDASASKYRTNRMDSRVRNIGKELTENVFENPEQYLPDVVNKLTAGITDSFTKTKVIHDWICDNIAYDAKMYFGLTRYTGQDYISVIKKKMGVCAGYAALFNKMCSLAGIESIIINGYSKGFGYTGNIDSGPDHDWNAVKINNKWYLVDVTWDAGHLYRRIFIKKYTTNYLFLDSRPFMYSHLPSNNKYQFYAPYVTKTQFVEEPYIAGAFFKYGISLKSDLPHYNNMTDGQFSFNVELKNTNVQYYYELETTEQREIEGASWAIRRGSVVTFIYDIPDRQRYRGSIFARMKNDKKIWEFIDANIYEKRTIPGLDTLIQHKNITEKEKEFFLKSYYKVDENNGYHFLEDQFDTARNNAVLKIHPLLNLSLEHAEQILGFNISPQAEYKGYGSAYKKRYPLAYTYYDEVPNTNLISPLNGVLKKGTQETIIIESRDFSRFSVKINNKYIYSERNNDGTFGITFDIPDNTKEIILYGEKNNYYNGLLRYEVGE